MTVMQISPLKRYFLCPYYMACVWRAQAHFLPNPPRAGKERV